MTFDSTPVRAGFRSEHVREAYNEDAFRYFLAVERARARRSERCLFLVLVAIHRTPGRRAHIPDTIAAALFTGLGASVREVDFVGWYKEGRVPAAVLAQGNLSDATMARAIADRVRAELKKRLSLAQADTVRVRVVRIGGSRSSYHEQ